MRAHKPCWWWRVAKRLFPSRCREIPRADRPDVVLIRQVELIKDRAYLQQFAAAEEVGEYHSHPWAGGTLAIGLAGWLQEEEPFAPESMRYWLAPYFRVMSAGHIHRTAQVGRGHTSIFIGLGKKTDEKFYYDLPRFGRHCVQLRKTHYKDKIKAFVRFGSEEQMTREEFERERQ